MRKLIFLLLFQIPIILFGQVPSNDKNWNSTPVLNENFSGTRSWNYNRVDNTGTWYAFFTESGVTHSSNEHQVYQRENALFNTPSAGYMTLRAEYKPNTTSYWFPYWAPVTGAWDYFSGAIESVQKFKYGYFEMRATLPPANYGNFPAFWLWSGTNRYSEIDIFEHVIHKSTDYKRIFGTYYTSSGAGESRADYYLSSSEPPLTNYHTYAIEWSPKVIIWYFDGRQIGAALNENEVTDEPMPVKVNYALDNYIFDDVNHNTDLFPLDMKIDYIRVYQLDCDCNTNTSISNSTQLNNYSHSVKKKITIQSSSSTIKVQGEGVTLRATDEITINGNFEVPIGTEFYATTHACLQ